MQEFIEIVQKEQMGSEVCDPTAIDKQMRLSLLVEKVDKGYYRVTDTGQRYLEGDFNANELETEN